MIHAASPRLMARTYNVIISRVDLRRSLIRKSTALEMRAGM